MSIDTEQFRVALLEERERVEKAIANLRDDHPGAIEDEVGPVTLDAVREALLAELVGEHDVRPGALDAALLEQAERFEDSHRIA